jgi:hypothetical protein
MRSEAQYCDGYTMQVGFNWNISAGDGGGF